MKPCDPSIIFTFSSIVFAVFIGIILATRLYIHRELREEIINAMNMNIHNDCDADTAKKIFIEIINNSISLFNIIRSSNTSLYIISALLFSMFFSQLTLYVYNMVIIDSCEHNNSLFILLYGVLYLFVKFMFLLVNKLYKSIFEEVTLGNINGGVY